MLEAPLDGRGHHMGGDESEADCGDDRESDDEDPFAGGRGEEEASGGQQSEACRQHVARSLAIDQPAGERRDRRHDDERHGGRPGNEAAGPAQLPDPGGHREAQGGSRRECNRQGQKAQPDGEPRAGIALPGSVVDAHGRSPSLPV